MNSNKQLVGLKLTSVPGELTTYEVTIKAQQGEKELLPDWLKVNNIMSITKPIDGVV